MTINNLPLISNLVPFAGDNFSHLQILRRGKDHPELPAANKLIKSYLVRDADHLAQIMPEVIFLCEHYKARAYISAEIKSIAKLNTLIMCKLANNQHLGNIINPWHVFNSACGELQGVEKRWVVDVDSKDETLLDIIKLEIDRLWVNAHPEYEGRPRESGWLIMEIPTPNGYHLITKPFNVKAFNERFSDVIVKKNGLTLLYMPEL